VAPLLKHPAGVVALSDAGAHLIYFCDAGFGLHFLAHWVRETGTFTLEEGVRRLTSDPARKYRIPGRGLIAPGSRADLVLFDPATGRHLEPGARGRSSRRRHAHDPQAARRARRVGERTTRVRRREIYSATVRSGGGD
jgi:adenine deaminase